MTRQFLSADEERAMRTVIASAPDQYARPHRSAPVSQHPRCECHDCTQARIPLFERQMLQWQKPLPVEFYMGTEALEPKNLALRAERHDEEIRIAEREHCAKLAEEAIADMLVLNERSEKASYINGAVNKAKEIAARIRSGE